MKKFLSAILCLVLTILMLVSCGDKDIGSYIDKYEKPKVKEELTYNLYIICEDGTSSNAIKNVQRRIADYTGNSDMQTTLNVKYFTESEYESVVLNKKLDGTEAQADILLINSADLMDKLIEADRLADITQYINGNYEYAKLNAQIANSLMKGSLIEKLDENGDVVLKNYCVPNNYVVGSYKYITIDSQVAALHKFSELDLLQKTPGSFGTEYLWVLFNQELNLGLTLDDTDQKYIWLYEGSAISDPALLEADFECLNVTDPKKEGGEYTYLFFCEEAAEKYSTKNITVSSKGITTITEARKKYLYNEDPKKNLAQSRFDEIFKEIKSSVAYSQEELDLIENEKEYYFNQIKREDNLYDYVMFDIDKAKAVGLDDNIYFANCGRPEENSVIALWESIKSRGDDPENYIKVQTGNIQAKAVYESNGLICNISELPSASREDVFAGAFAINAKVANVERAMEVIYAINNDKTLHNYLQYGIPDTNYAFKDDLRDSDIIIRIDDESSKYFMNPRYTGNTFGLLYCEELGWMEEHVAPGKAQNDASVYKP